MINPSHHFPDVEPHKLNATLNRFQNYYSTYGTQYTDLRDSGVEFANPGSLDELIGEDEIKEAWAAFFPDQDPPPPMDDFFYLGSGLPLSRPLFGKSAQQLSFTYIIGANWSLQDVQSHAEALVAQNLATDKEIRFDLACLRHICCVYSQLEACMVIRNLCGLDNRGRPVNED